MTRIRSIVICLFILGFGFLDRVQSDVVVPSDRVSTGVNVRDTPKTSGKILKVLAPGEQLQYVGTVPGWNEVILSDGRLGFVSKSWTRVIPTDETGGTTSGNFTIDVVDVGTGLGIFVRGPDFALVYDGGSNDDFARGSANRFLSFLKSQYPDLTVIDHMILSHPHRDHVELLPDVIAAYQVRNFWDSGAVNDICGYRAFIQAISDEPQAVYHSALFDFGSHPVSFTAGACYGQTLPAANIPLPYGSRIDHLPVVLGASASMTILHADGAKHSDFNENSLVVRLDFGQNKILFMGDAEGGGRADPGTPPAAHSIESILLDCCAAELRANVLIVGHHGSKTSSRVAFLNAVGAKIFVISSGPTKYKKVVLPDDEVVQELERRGDLFRTNLDDISCKTNPAKIGPDNDGEAGGCDNVRIILSNTAPPAITYLRVSD